MPKVILVADRMKIRSGDTKVMKFYMTLFNIYRVLDFAGNLKLSTITSPFSGSYREMGEILSYIPAFVAALKLGETFGPTLEERKALTTRYGIFAGQMLPNPAHAVRDWLNNQYSNLEARVIKKSAPGVMRNAGIEISTHPLVLIRSAIALRDTPIWEFFKVFLEKLPFNNPVRKAFEASAACSDGFKGLPSLGKLGIKEEAAGKVRVFAMVDAWTQWLLLPVHELYFTILRGLPQDGTFDQLKPLKHAPRWAGAYSLDLTAATDRLPLGLQKALLSAIVGDFRFAEAWGHLLTDRTYWLANMEHGVFEGFKYTVGQPMGALSSWASLAITHHFIIQVAAWRARVVPTGVWFKHYAVLGDDLVVGDRKVAEEYLRVLKILGVECGLHKSVLSNGNTVIEFAKRTFYKGVDISPIPFSEYAAALTSLGAMREFVTKYSLDLVQILKTFGFGYRVLGGLAKPLGRLNYKVRLIVLALNVPTTQEEVQRFFAMGSPITGLVKVDATQVAKTFVWEESSRLSRTLLARWNTVLSNSKPFWNLGSVIRDLLPSLVERNVFVPSVLRTVENMDRFAPLNPGQVTVVPVPGSIGGTQRFTEPFVEGPAELKEISKGWVIVSGDGLETPVDVLSPAVPVRVLDESLFPYNSLQRALASLADMLILPERARMLDTLGPIVDDLTSKRMLESPITFELVYDWFLGMSRASASVSLSTLDLNKELAPDRGTDPIAIRLWKRWSSILQGTRTLSSVVVKPRVKEVPVDPLRVIDDNYITMMRTLLDVTS